MIRPGEVADIPRLIEIGVPFVRVMPGAAREPDYSAMANYLHGFIQAPHGYLAVTETGAGTVTGFISGYMSRDPFSGDPVAQKSSWLVDPQFAGHGVALLRGFERWAGESGAERTYISRFEADDRTERLLRKAGYAEIETTYEKVI